MIICYSSSRDPIQWVTLGKSPPLQPHRADAGVMVPDPLMSAHRGPFQDQWGIMGQGASPGNRTVSTDTQG